MVRDFDDFRAQANGAIEKWKAAQARIAERDSLPAAGDIYVFSATAEIGLEWVIVLQHAEDDALWFMVPFDQNPMAGTWDISVSESSTAGPGTLRCGRGIWIHIDDLTIGSRSGFLELWYIDKARARLASMVAPAIDASDCRPEVDFDPDYQEWLDEVTTAAEHLEAKLRAAPEVVSILHFSDAWTSSLPSRWCQAKVDAPMLVAETSGLAAGPKEPVSPLPGEIIAVSLPGNLVAVFDGIAVRLLYYPQGSEQSPNLQFSVGDAAQSITWRILPDRVSESIEALSPMHTVVHLPDGSKKMLSNGD